MSSWSHTVAQRVTAIRTQRGMSLSALAKAAHMSKATLSGLENGKGNPTLDTIDRLALALAVPVADLLVAQAPRTRLVRAEDPSTATGPFTQLMARVPQSLDWEFWTLVLRPGESFAGVAHHAGTIEVIRLAAGSLTCGPDDEPVVLGPGDLLEFAGDCAHTYRAGTHGAEALVALGTTNGGAGGSAGTGGSSDAGTGAAGGAL
ncbi:helix-turn-helix domain-containing protein [Brevibacterium litoralis]|uniref:helix-turn-helix domain-containing protein n=1 Tax=Brevibacterium litoralis TaxID=3138935 RepID=UPI0032EE7D56